MAGGKPARELPLKRESTEIFVHALGSAAAIGGYSDLVQPTFAAGYRVHVASSLRAKG